MAFSVGQPVRIKTYNERLSKPAPLYAFQNRIGTVQRTAGVVTGGLLHPWLRAYDVAIDGLLIELKDDWLEVA